MIERLVENWLTNVNELGYQLAFGQVLVSQGYTILHMSRHGRGEHGKDIIASAANGDIFTFQLKGGDIGLGEWRQIRGEVEELVRLPARRAGLPDITQHTPVLVTNGELKGDASESIALFSETWVRSGAPELRVWQRGELLRMFLDTHDEFLPKERPDLKLFVELFIADFGDRLNRVKFARLLSDIHANAGIANKPTRAARAIDSIVLLSYYIVQQYEQAGNWISAMEAWSLVAARIMYMAATENLSDLYYQPALTLCWMGFRRNFEDLIAELDGRENFIEPRHMFAEPVVYGSRAAMTLGWATAAHLSMQQAGERWDPQVVLRAFKREGRRLQFVTEADWPYVVSMAAFLEQYVSYTQAEHLLKLWCQTVTTANVKAGNKEFGFPNPYWSQEKAIELHIGELPAYEREDFRRHTYTAYQALTMLVRRLCRAAVSVQWPSTSRLLRCDFNPSDPNAWLLWYTDEGITEFEDPLQPVKWSEWRARSEVVNSGRLPPLILKHPEWILPIVLTMPHRLNDEACGVIDALVNKRATVGP